MILKHLEYLIPINTSCRSEVSYENSLGIIGP